MIEPAEVIEGTKLWLEYRPWRRLRAAIRNRVNKRRARLGKPLLPVIVAPQGGVFTMPKHVVSWTGLGAILVGIVLHYLGVGQCTPEQVAAAVQSCVDPGVIDKIVADLSDLFVQGGTLVAAVGKVRAMKREAAAEAATK